MEILRRRCCGGAGSLLKLLSEYCKKSYSGVNKYTHKVIFNSTVGLLHLQLFTLEVLSKIPY